MTDLHAGTVTFAFTDIEGSTRLLQELGDDGYGAVSREHRRSIRETCGTSGGREIDTQGDAFFFSFARARDAVTAAVEAQRRLRDHEWPEGHAVRVRMGLHTGEPQVGDEGYLGLDVVRAARIASAGTGGQILISETTRALLGNTLPDGVAVVDLGRQELKDIQHEHIYELSIDGRARGYRAPKQAPRNSRADDIAAHFEQRVERYVEDQLERAFSGESAGVPTKPDRHDRLPDLMVTSTPIVKSPSTVTRPSRR